MILISTKETANFNRYFYEIIWNCSYLFLPCGEMLKTVMRFLDSQILSTHNKNDCVNMIDFVQFTWIYDQFQKYKVMSVNNVKQNDLFAHG